MYEAIIIKNKNVMMIFLSGEWKKEKSLTTSVSLNTQQLLM